MYRHMGRCIDGAPSPLSNQAVQGTKILLRANTLMLGKSPQNIRERNSECARTKTTVTPPANPQWVQVNTNNRKGRFGKESQSVSKSHPEIQWSLVADTNSRTTAVFFSHRPRWARQKSVPPRLSQFHFPVIRHPSSRSQTTEENSSSMSGKRSDDSVSILLPTNQTPRPASRRISARIEKPKVWETGNSIKKSVTNLKSESSGKRLGEKKSVKTQNTSLRLDAKKEVRLKVSDFSAPSPVQGSEIKMNDQSECASGKEQNGFFWTESLPEEVRQGCCFYHLVGEGARKKESPKASTRVAKRTAFENDEALVQSVKRLSTKHMPRPRRGTGQEPCAQSAGNALPELPSPVTRCKWFSSSSPQLLPDSTATDTRTRASLPCSVINMHLNTPKEVKGPFSFSTKWHHLLDATSCSVQRKRRDPASATNYLRKATANQQGDQGLATAAPFTLSTPDSDTQSDNSNSSTTEEKNPVSMMLTSKTSTCNCNMSANLEYQNKSNTPILHVLDQKEDREISSGPSEPAPDLKGEHRTSEEERENQMFDRVVSNIQVDVSDSRRCKNEFKNLMLKRGWKNESEGRYFGIPLYPGDFIRKGKVSPSWKWVSDPIIGRRARSIGRSESERSSIFYVRGRNVGSVWRDPQGGIERESVAHTYVHTHPSRRGKNECLDFTNTCNPLDTGFCLPSRLHIRTDLVRSDINLTEINKQRPIQSSSSCVSVSFNELNTKPKSILKNSRQQHYQTDGPQDSDTVVTERMGKGNEMRRGQNSEPASRTVLQDECLGRPWTQEACQSEESDLRNCFLESGDDLGDLNPRLKPGEFGSQGSHFRNGRKQQRLDLAMKELALEKSMSGLQGQGDDGDEHKNETLCASCRHVMKWVTTTMDSKRALEW